MAARRFFLEEAALLKESLAELLRNDPPATLEGFEDLEYALECAGDLAASLLQEGSPEGLLLNQSTLRLVTGLQALRRVALEGVELRSDASRSVFRRFSVETPDGTSTTVAVADPSTLQLDLRVLVESASIGTAGQGMLTVLPAWLVRVLCLEVHASAGAEPVALSPQQQDADIVEAALALWDPLDSSAVYGRFSDALDAAGSLLCG